MAGDLEDNIVIMVGDSVYKQTAQFDSKLTYWKEEVFREFETKINEQREFIVQQCSHIQSELNEQLFNHMTEVNHIKDRDPDKDKYLTKEAVFRIHELE